MNTIYQAALSGSNYTVIARNRNAASERLHSHTGDMGAFSANWIELGRTHQPSRVAVELRPNNHGNTEARLFGYNTLQGDVLVARAAVQAQLDRTERGDNCPTDHLDTLEAICHQCEESLLRWGFTVIKSDPELAGILARGTDIEEEWINDSPIWRGNRDVLIDIFMGL